MASEAERGEIEIEKMKSNDKESVDVVVVVSIDLPAPDGWAKKFTPKQGGTPRRNEIVFISPTGEEIKNKRQLDLYLKSHPGGPSVSEFDWGTGDTPRRSARIKSKSTESPETEPAKKMQKKSSSSKKGKKAKKDDIDGEAEPEEDEDVAPEETKVSADVEMKDAEDAGDHDKAEVTVEETLMDKIETAKDPLNESEIKLDEKPENPKTSNGANSGKKEEDENVAAEETKESVDVEMEKAGDCDKVEVATEDAVTGKVDTINDPLPESEIKTDEKPENPDKINEATSGKNEEHDGDKSTVTPGPEDIKEEAEKEKSDPEAPSQVPNETDAEVKKASEAVKMGEEDKEATATTTTTTTTEKASDVEVVKSDSESLKEGQEVGKSTENDQGHPPSHEPKASEVS